MATRPPTFFTPIPSAGTATTALNTPSFLKSPTSGSILGGIGSIYSGISTYRASNALASDLRMEGEILFREANRTAEIIIQEGIKFAAGQSLQYIGSGVQIAGSALVTLAQTRKYAANEAQAVRERGAAEKTLANRKAKRTEDEGRASLVTGIVGGVASMFL